MDSKEIQVDNFEEQKTIVDLVGESEETAYTKVLIDEGQKPGEIIGVELKNIPDFKDPEKKTAKIFVTVKVNDPKEGDVEVPLILTPLVTKAPEGSKRINSKMYDVLDKLKLLDEFKDSHDVAGGFSFKGTADWLENRLIGKAVSVLIETTTKAKTPYSKVTKVYGFIVEEKKE